MQDDQSRQDPLLSLVEATRVIPGRPSFNCVWRWCRRGVLARNGERVRLQHVRVGSRPFTKASWAIEFSQKLAEQDLLHFDDQQPLVMAPELRGNRRRQAEKRRSEEIDRIQRELKAEGI